MKSKYWIIYIKDNGYPQVLDILRRGTIKGVRFTASMIHRTNLYGDKQNFQISGPFETEREAEDEIQNRG